LYIKYSGIYYGQCSEICGTNHAFMPIGIVSFDLGLPLYVLEDVFSDLEPIIISLQTQGEAIGNMPHDSLNHAAYFSITAFVSGSMT